MRQPLPTRLGTLWGIDRAHIDHISMPRYSLNHVQTQAIQVQTRFFTKKTPKIPGEHLDRGVIETSKTAQRPRFESPGDLDIEYKQPLPSQQPSPCGTIDLAEGAGKQPFCPGPRLGPVLDATNPSQPLPTLSINHPDTGGLRVRRLGSVQPRLDHEIGSQSGHTWCFSYKAALRSTCKMKRGCCSDPLVLI